MQFSKNSPGKVGAFAPLPVGGDEENRTPDPLLARQVLSQLSYAPMCLLSFPPFRCVIFRSSIKVSMVCFSFCRSRKCFSENFFFSETVSFGVKEKLVGLSGLEPLTSRLSGVRSNQLSYRPICRECFLSFESLILSKLNSLGNH